ncbi:PREDICTED: uncharacterized protein LOC105454131 [Wasmannia auropunctata]|uniref:uncharacterized protein LOC105454131 n=1 Tax=Wasmannia auropunctata TaxID=64793 RepID=UPI0005EF4A5A|nr:PREDICTED: uncharacterized protein LOC105454131 [Wasmannia auropunctata]
MPPAMSSGIAIREIGFILILLVSFAQAVDYELHRHDTISANWNGNVILTSRDYLEQLNFVTRKASYTLQEATEHLLHFGALLRARILDTFGSLLYDYYDDFNIAEVEALRKVYRKILERQYDVFDLVPGILRKPDTRPSRICAEIYDRVTESCLRSSASVCRRIRKHHDLPHLDDRHTPALNATYRMYRLSKVSKQYPRGFSLATLLRLLQRQVLTITPNLLSGLFYNVRYDSYDDDVRLAERELIRHFREISMTNEISVLSTEELRNFHTMNSFLKYYVSTYAEKFADDDLKKYALLIARSITDDVGIIDENIYLLGNVYENGMIHVKYLFDLVLPDDVLEKDVVEAKKYLVTKLNKFKVVEKYLRVQRYQQVTPAQLTMEITRQLIDIDFAKSIATSLRMHASFWRRSRMIESLEELLELFDTYENLRQVPRYRHMMQKIDKIKENLRDMKNVRIEILCNAPRACLRMGLQLVLYCKLISSSIKDSIKDFLHMSDVCVNLVYMIEESQNSMKIPFSVSKNVSTLFQTTGMVEVTPTHSTIEFGNHSLSESEETAESEVSNETKEVTTRTSSEENSEFTSTMAMTTPRTTIEHMTTTRQEESTTAATMSITAAETTTPSSTTITTLPTTTTTLPTTEFSATTLPATTTTLFTTTTTLSTTTTSPATTTTILPTTTTASPTTTTTILPTTTTASPTTTTTILPTTTTASPTTTTTTLPTTTSTMLPTTSTTTSSPATTTSLVLTAEQPTVVVKIERTKVRKVHVPYSKDEVTKPSTVSITTPAARSCESIECISKHSSEGTGESGETTTLLSTTPISSLETARATSSKPTIHQNFVSESTASSTTEMSEAPVTKGDKEDCIKSCLKDCKEGVKNESVEGEGGSERSCEISCDSVTEDCNGADSKPPSKDSSEVSSSECGTDVDRSCECATKEERNDECVTLCPSAAAESSSCGSDCATSTEVSTMPTIGITFERNRTRIMCEIRDPHHHRQLKRLAKMRAISTAAATVVTSRHQGRIMSKKMYNLDTKMPYFKSRTRYSRKRPSLDGRLSGTNKSQRQREQIKSRKQLARKLSGKMSRKTAVHRTRGSTSFQIKRISEKGAKSISA